MNRSIEHRELDSRQIDRLVDGELCESERQSLLLRLDSQPQQWRTVALQFLESQCFNDVCRSAVAGPRSDVKATVDQPVSASDEPIPLRTRGFRRMATAMLASFALAFGLGIFAHTRWSADSAGTSTQSGVNGRAAKNGENNTGNKSPGQNPVVLRVNGSSRPLPADGKTQFVRGSVDRRPSAEGRSLELPLIDASAAEIGLLRPAQSIFPADLVDQLRRSGHQIRETHRLYPVQLKDGRRILLPVNDVELKYLGNKRFQ
ncbi:MAG: hypothetical protein IID45_08735 [Planctomycetes bacterium]|nr:hypothetical protein [Planctomycetota bacterium]